MDDIHEEFRVAAVAAAHDEDEVVVDRSRIRVAPRLQSSDIFWAAKTGDLERMRYFVEVEGQPLDQRSFDATPLYYASLCGHVPVVRYLLEKGANCDEETFDGERCHYGALTPEIRQLLQQYAAAERTSALLVAMKRCLEGGTGVNGDFDICFEVEGQLLRAHRVVLAARSEFFYKRCRGKWRQRWCVPVRHPGVSAEAFRAMLEFCYTDRLALAVEHVDGLVLLLRVCGMNSLAEHIEADTTVSRDFKLMLADRRQLVVKSPAGVIPLREAMAALASRCRRRTAAAEAGSGAASDEHTLQCQRERAPLFGDVLFCVRDCLFECHRVILSARCDYFRTLFSSAFRETAGAAGHAAGAHAAGTDAAGAAGAAEATGAANARTPDPVHKPIVAEVELPGVSPRVFAVLLQFLYSDTLPFLNYENAVEVLDLAQQFLLQDLKAALVARLTRFFAPDTLVDMLRLAEVYSPALAGRCGQWIGEWVARRLLCAREQPREQARAAARASMESLPGLLPALWTLGGSDAVRVRTEGLPFVLPEAAAVVLDQMHDALIVTLSRALLRSQYDPMVDAFDEVLVEMMREAVPDPQLLLLQPDVAQQQDMWGQWAGGQQEQSQQQQQQQQAAHKPMAAQGSAAGAQAQ